MFKFLCLANAATRICYLRQPLKPGSIFIEVGTLVIEPKQATTQKSIINYKDRQTRNRLGTNTDDQGKTCGETDNDEPSCGLVRTVQKSKNLTEMCEVCHKRFKKRGIKIHQAKSGCKEVLNRIRKSKSDAGRSQTTVNLPAKPNQRR